MNESPFRPSDFDRLMRSRPDALWGLPAIGAALGVSADTVRRWILDPRIDVPVSRCGGRWFARRSDLEAWRSR